jgi:hypothetical protein
MQRVSTILLVLTVCVCSAAERHWQTGTWADVGLKHDPWVGGGTSGLGPNGQVTNPRPLMPEVATYVIETPDVRLELRDLMPIGGHGSFDTTVKIDDPVTFALVKNTVYVRNADGTEHKLRVTRKVSRNKNKQ